MATFLSFIKRQFLITPKAVDANEHNLQNQCGIVTGSNVGLGLEASRHLLRLGLSKLVLAVRSQERGQNAKRQLATQYPKAEILVWVVDMASYNSIQAFVEKCKTLPRLDFAILNAGVAKLNFALNPSTKHEETIQINYLSTCLLATLLLPVLKSPKGHGKITIVGSETAAWTPFKQQKNNPILPSLDQEKGFNGTQSYELSKLLADFYVKELGVRMDPDKVVVNIVNPGLCRGSDLHRELPLPLSIIVGAFKQVFGRTCEVGSRPIVNAAVVQGEDSHGQYFSDNDITPMPPLTQGPDGKTLSARLWKELMEELEFANAAAVVNGMGKSGS